MNAMEEIKSGPPQSPSTTPLSKTPESPSQSMGLGSPELLKELKQPHTLKPVYTHTGLTKVFSGRGRINSPPAPASNNQHTAEGLTHRLSGGTSH